MRKLKVLGSWVIIRAFVAKKGDCFKTKKAQHNVPGLIFALPQGLEPWTL